MYNNKLEPDEQLIQSQTQDKYKGYEEVTAPENSLVQQYFETTLANIPKFYVLEKHIPNRSKLPFLKSSVDLPLLMRQLRNPSSPYISRFSTNQHFFGKYSAQRKAFFLRENSSYFKSHELAHPYTEKTNPELFKNVITGHLEQPPTDAPFVSHFIYEGIAELVATDIGLNKAQGLEYEEAEKWKNFRLTGNKIPGLLPPDKEYLLDQFTKAQKIIDQYKAHPINPQSTLRIDQYQKVLHAFESHPDSTESSSNYTLGYVYCLATYNKLKSEGFSTSQAIQQIVKFPPQSMNEIKASIGLLAA